MFHLDYAKAVLVSQKKFYPFFVALTSHGLAVVPSVGGVKNAKQAKAIAQLALNTTNAFGYIWIVDAYASRGEIKNGIVKKASESDSRDSLLVCGQLVDEYGSIVQYYKKQNDRILFEENIYSDKPFGGKMRLKLIRTGS